MTLTPHAWGEAVARSTYSKVRERISAYYNADVDDRGFFLRFSYAEGKYGEIIFDHFGVQQLWPISEAQFGLTKEFFMTPAMHDMEVIFGIDWMSLRYQELNIPTYSCIAFFLYLEAIEAYPIPWSVEGQGELYEKISTKPVIQWTTFITDLNNIGEEVCRNEATDLVFLIDQSGSIGPDNFALMTSFVTGVVATLNVAQNNTRVSARTFSIGTHSHFKLSDYKSDLVQSSRNVRDYFLL